MCEKFQVADSNRFKFSEQIIRECHLLDPMEWIILIYVRRVIFHPFFSYSIRKCHSIALRILILFKIQNTQLPLFKLYGMAMCLNLESLEILQIKI